jgi:hypothetical protein
MFSADQISNQDTVHIHQKGYNSYKPILSMLGMSYVLHIEAY